MNKQELKELMKESIREVLKEDNTLKLLFSESLKTSIGLILENVNLDKGGSSGATRTEQDILREQVKFSRNMAKDMVKSSAPKRQGTFVNKVDPMLARMMALTNVDDFEEE